MDIDLNSFDAIFVNIIASWLIQKMKLSQWAVFRWISTETPTINAFVSVIFAAATAAGMTVNWQDAGATHTLTITGISVANVLLFAWHVAKNAAFQHGAYKLLFKPAA